MLEAVAEEFRLGEKSANVGMLRITQERTEVDDLLGGVIELQTQTMAADVLGMRDIDDDRVHGSVLVILSGETDLCRTK